VTVKERPVRESEKMTERVIVTENKTVTERVTVINMAMEEWLTPEMVTMMER
jgi:hypothetical protein